MLVPFFIPLPLFASSHVHPYFSYLDFKNPNDPHDDSFDPHPTNYPVAELEFPNSGATERYVFSASLFPMSMASGNTPSLDSHASTPHPWWSFLLVLRLAIISQLCAVVMTRARSQEIISALNACATLGISSSSSSTAPH
jgi:hypothetical protein